ncbi:hypothetical protein AAE478_010202 [Parahypoxylon ruwenzoriense]
MESPWTFVETTLPCMPLPPNSRREPIKTRRLVIRPMREYDLDAYYQLRSQLEAMTGTSLGRPDRDIEESRSALRVFLPPEDAKIFLFGAFLSSTGRVRTNYT